LKVLKQVESSLMFLENPNLMGETYFIDSREGNVIKRGKKCLSIPKKGQLERAN